MDPGSFRARQEIPDYRSRGRILRDPGEDDERCEFLVKRMLWIGQHRSYGQYK